MTASAPIVIVDLDGTLVRGNTLHQYIRCGFRLGSVRTKASIAWWLALRRLRFVSHKRMKWAMMGIIAPSDGLKALFVQKIRSIRNGKVRDVLEKFRHDGCRIILATAAPATYVPWIWDGEFVASDMNRSTNPHRTECRGTAKLHAAKSIARGAPIRAMLTDHVDDLPLLQFADHTGAQIYLVEPSARTLMAVNAAGITYTLIKDEEN